MMSPRTEGGFMGGDGIGLFIIGGALISAAGFSTMMPLLGRLLLGALGLLPIILSVFLMSTNERYWQRQKEEENRFWEEFDEQCRKTSKSRKRREKKQKEDA